MKDKLNYKLVNCVLIMLIIFLIYKMGDLWVGVVRKLIGLALPFIVAFAVAYILYPVLRFLQKKKIPKPVAMTMIIVGFFAILGLLGVIIFPVLFTQLTSLFAQILEFVKDCSEGNIDLSGFEHSLANYFDSIKNDLGKFVSDGAINAIGVSLSFASNALIAFASSLYFLADMEKIRKKAKLFLKKKSKRMLNYVHEIDHAMYAYLKGFFRIMCISIFEYSIAYTIIGHPNAILLGMLAAVFQLIPYFGGIIGNIIAAITAFVISPVLFVKTVILFVILSSIDGYVINPIVYGKTNQVHPLIVIASVFVGGALFGVPGIIVSLPVAIILLTTYKYFEKDILGKIEDIEEQLKK